MDFLDERAYRARKKLGVYRDELLKIISPFDQIRIDRFNRNCRTSAEMRVSMLKCGSLGTYVFIIQSFYEHWGYRNLFALSYIRINRCH